MTTLVFEKRITAPSATDKNYIHYTYGGYNYCIHISNGSVLSNCVGYAWGRWRELLGSYHNLSRANAEDWWAKSDGYERGQVPKVGAIMCWAKGLTNNGWDGAGHVAVVEEVLQNGRVLCSNSNYGGTNFFMLDMLPPYHLGNTYRFQGFIYPPINFVQKSDFVAPKKSIDQLVKEVLSGQWGNGADRVNRLTNAGYDAAKVQEAVNSHAVKKPALKPLDVIAKEVIQGLWGTGSQRKQLLENYGYNFFQVQNRVNELLTPKKSIEQVAKEVINGVYGTGSDRVTALKKAGYDPAIVQERVNQLLAPHLKPIDVIAKEVVNGDWGNGADRVNKLTKAGYNPVLVQQKVNSLL